MRPKQAFDLPKSNVSAPPPYRTLMRNNQIFYFDKSGKLLDKLDAEAPNFSDFLYRMKTKNNRNHLKKAIFDSTYTVTYLNDSIAEISKVFNNLDEVQNPDLLGKLYKAIVNTKQNLTLTESIYDENEKPIFIKQNSYDKKREVPIPVFSKTQLKVVNSVGEASVAVSISQCENIEITNNL